METSPAPWIDALRRSHDRLHAVAGPLDLDQLQQTSYASEWSIAQVLSHIGSQAEIFGLFLDAGLSEQDPPGPDAFPPIWETWNAKSPQDQAADALRADETVTARFESLDDDQLKRFRLSLFGMDLDAAGLARMRLGEHAVHTWDVAVALDPAATLAPDAVGLLIDTLGQLAARAGKPGGIQRRLHVSTSSPVRACGLGVQRGPARAGASGRGVHPPGLRAPRPRPHAARRDPTGGPRRAAAGLPGFLNARGAPAARDRAARLSQSAPGSRPLLRRDERMAA